ncbi:MAG: AmmeMemoRadiSam system protein B [Thermodesulfobacteriota bacterium]
MKIRVVAGALLLILACSCGAQPPAEAPFPPLFARPEPFLQAIQKNRAKPLPVKITGLTVPHHLLAADLIAASLARLAEQGYERIVILSPDHFSRSRTVFAVTRRNFGTPFGTLRTDQTAVRRLLENPRVSLSGLFSHEHGVQALLPFLAYYFPQARIVPLAIHRAAKPRDWDALAQTLAPLLTSDTLVIQSTDFSHYLPLAEAKRKDQETLRVLSGGDPAEVIKLTEPGHLDCRAAQYLQLRLQAEVFRTRPTVAAHGNSQDYTAAPLSRTTSYLVQFYSPDFFPVDAGERWFFGGDTFLGRGLAPLLKRGKGQEDLLAQVLKITGGSGLIVNLEGVIRTECPERPKPFELCMETGLTLALLKKLKVRAVSLANNHTRDGGAKAYREMTRTLKGEGILPLENGCVTDLGPFRLAVFTDVDNQGQPKTGVLTEEDLGCLDGVPRDKPLFAFLHWGREYRAEPGLREKNLTARLAARGVELTIGSHPHRAGDLKGNAKTCQAFSLGNFLFDQTRPGVSGALLEVIFFPQGTYFLRRHHLENLYQRLLSHAEG